MSLSARLFSVGAEGGWRDTGLFLLRAGLSATMLTHGWSKVQRFAEISERFPDPLGVGSTASLALVIFAEFACAIAVLLGVATRFAAFPLVVTMAVAFFIHHGADPLEEKELAWAYLVGFTSVLLTGPGRLSLDAVISRSRRGDGGRRRR
jgi:putative oxidoreductase